MRDLFVTELGMDPVEDKALIRDLLADEPAPTFQEQIERHSSDTIGETEDEKRLIENLFTEEERAEIAKMPQIGFCEAIKGKGLVRSLPFIGSGLEVGEGIADVETRLTILAGIEGKVLETYDYLPMLQDAGQRLLSQQMFYVTDEYNAMLGYGGLAYTKYNYTDAEWTAYVAEQGGELKY